MPVTGAISAALRLAAATGYAPQAQEEWLVACRQVDWAALVQEAADAGISSLLYQAVQTLPEACAPPAARQTLHARYLQVGLLNAYLLPQFAAVVQALSSAGVEPVVLKGAALAAVVYDNVALRPMSDLDLLIPFPDLPAAQSCLAALNFAPPAPPPFANESGLFWNQQLWQRTVWQPVSVELHWALLDLPYYARRWPATELRQRSRSILLEGMTARALAVEDQLLHLCAHNFYHHLGQLARVGPDIGYFLRQCQPDWDLLLAQAARCHLGLAVKQTLLAAFDQWRVPVDPAVRIAVEKLPAHPYEIWFQRCQRHELLKVARTALTLPGGKLRLRYIWKQVFPERAYLLWRYGLPADATTRRAYLTRLRSRLPKRKTALSSTTAKASGGG